MKADGWFDSTWTAGEWRRIRWGIALTYLPWIAWVVLSYSSQPVPTGIAKWIDLSFLTIPGINALVFGAAALCCWWYVRGERLLYATGGMLGIGILVFTLHDSQGAFQRNEVLNLVLLGQVVAHLQAHYQERRGNKESAETSRSRIIFYSQQMLLATYFISGITKLGTSGLNWVVDSPNISLQIYKAQMALYHSLDWPFLQDLALTFSDLAADYPLAVQFIFGGALALEVFCFIGLINRRLGRWVGWLILLMHLGVFLLLGVFFFPFFLLVIFLLVGTGGRKKEGTTA